MDAMEFFQRSAGKWRSQRSTHHLAFRRAELGELEITVSALTPDDPRVQEICTMHKVDSQLAAGGALVQWHGSMGWDREGEGHEDSTVMVIVPDVDNPRKGKLLREKGYAEIVPVAGQYEMDDEDGLNLITEYETMSAIERFSFADDSGSIRLRTSTVKRFGGFNTASFCIETRIDSPAETNAIALPEALKASWEKESAVSLLGW
ncbi:MULTISPECIES: phycobiliprotein lyase [unclassified Roseofilum]|uniref:phycobiliprotein lyase n=1 Tax=unclassified Roseofilum TaxID=2620099 RepID=UPI000E9E56ED|nr:MULTISPECIES: phycobiliprotein lyase [unclassified Roseofilum]MBP0009146.1 phycobiliprotein lyase [Roseofilum sp. Belize Diploria]MBP0026744.1 phycobiliprotein lyase [Roseofilum sp. SID2]MBP0033038.1 phycobiliprotein lyase [Roseofilum sp. Belize BBD 4]MBP0041208.1 phycobiliprotein lyase [Roseofilum sp. SBFL]HBQ98500.1 phycobiliprotein lyase [Cyanobacteria bacterium UBA11691]